MAFAVGDVPATFILIQSGAPETHSVSQSVRVAEVMRLVQRRTATGFFAKVVY